MPQLIKPGSVKVITQDGEIQVSISLDLNINLNNNNIQVDIKKEEKESPTQWAIPDFEESPRIKFGK